MCVCVSFHCMSGWYIVYASMYQIWNFKYLVFVSMWKQSCYLYIDEFNCLFIVLDNYGFLCSAKCKLNKHAYLCKKGFVTYCVVYTKSSSY